MAKRTNTEFTANVNSGGRVKVAVEIDENLTVDTQNEEEETITRINTANTKSGVRRLVENVTCTTIILAIILAITCWSKKFWSDFASSGCIAVGLLCIFLITFVLVSQVANREEIKDAEDSDREGTPWTENISFMIAFLATISLVNDVLYSLTIKYVPRIGDYLFTLAGLHFNFNTFLLLAWALTSLIYIIIIGVTIKAGRIFVEQEHQAVIELFEGFLTEKGPGFLWIFPWFNFFKVYHVYTGKKTHFILEDEDIEFDGGVGQIKDSFIVLQITNAKKMIYASRESVLIVKSDAQAALSAFLRQFTITKATGILRQASITNILDKDTKEEIEGQPKKVAEEKEEELKNNGKWKTYLKHYGIKLRELQVGRIESSGLVQKALNAQSAAEIKVGTTIKLAESAKEKAIGTARAEVILAKGREISAIKDAAALTTKIEALAGCDVDSATAVDLIDSLNKWDKISQHEGASLLVEGKSNARTGAELGIGAGLANMGDKP